MLAGEAFSPEQEVAWRTIRALADRFLKADLRPFAVSTWNYTVLDRLKHLFDLVSQRDARRRRPSDRTSGSEIGPSPQPRAALHTPQKAPVSSPRPAAANAAPATRRAGRLAVRFERPAMSPRPKPAACSRAVAATKPRP
jgi:hypothetical protein